MEKFSKQELTDILYYLQLARVKLMRVAETERADDTMFSTINNLIDKVNSSIKEDL